jgi:hypothetical protein
MLDSGNLIWINATSSIIWQSNSAGRWHLPQTASSLNVISFLILHHLFIFFRLFTLHICDDKNMNQLRFCCTTIFRDWLLK